MQSEKTVHFSERGKNKAAGVMKKGPAAGAWREQWLKREAEEEWWKFPENCDMMRKTDKSHRNRKRI